MKSAIAVSRPLASFTLQGRQQSKLRRRRKVVPGRQAFEHASQLTCQSLKTLVGPVGFEPTTNGL